MFLVSEPRRLTLTRNTLHDNHETTLVEPQLSVAKLTYFRCLVDAGPRFEEHAVVLEQEGTSATAAREVIGRALSAARPTTITFVKPNKTSYEATTIAGNKSNPAGLAAAAVCFACDRPDFAHNENELVSWAQTVVSRQGRFYVCELRANAALSR